MNYNSISLYTDWFAVLANGLARHVQSRVYCCWQEDDPIRQFILHEKNFDWMNVCKLNPQGCGVILVEASATCSGIVLAEGLHDFGRWAMP
jgi:hypothetical protein